MQWTVLASDATSTSEEHERVSHGGERCLYGTEWWEVPAGRIESEEVPEDAAYREVLEGTGWRLTGPLQPLVACHPANCICDLTFHLLTAQGAEYVGEPSGPSEAQRVWVPRHEARQPALTGALPDGLTLTALLFAMARGVL